MDVERLDGKTVLVTGAGSGIGRETALLCAARGADLAICDVDELGLRETEVHARHLGRDVLAQRVDVGNRAAMQAFANAVHEHCMHTNGVLLQVDCCHESLHDISAAERSR